MQMLLKEINKHFSTPKVHLSEFLEMSRETKCCTATARTWLQTKKTSPSARVATHGTTKIVGATMWMLSKEAQVQNTSRQTKMSQVKAKMKNRQT